VREFPARWAKAPIGAIASLINGRAFKPSEWGDSGLPIIRIQNLNRPDAAYNYFGGPLDPRHEVQHGELLFAWSGTPGTSFGAHIWSGSRAALNQHIFRVLHSEALLDRKFFKEAINNQLDELIRRAHGGAGLAHVTKDRFESIEVPVPSLAEQRRIVAKLEELFSELEAGVAALKRAQARLTRYRQSLLHAAVTGELTREWRAGEKGTDDVQLGKVNAVDSIPETWVMTTVGNLLREPLCNGLSIKESPTPTEVKALKLNAMKNNGFDFMAHRCLPIAWDQVEDLAINEGDLFVSRGNGSLHLVGRSVLAQAPPFPVIFPDTMIRLRLRDGLAPWVNAIWPSRSIRSQIEASVKTTAGIWKISQPQIRAIKLPLPPSEEREAILAELSRRLSAVEAMESTIHASLRRAERLRQSTLERAFRGELVPQDPNDEPAEALLARIKGEVEPAAPARRRGRPAKTAKG